MHIVLASSQTLDGLEDPVDLGQSPGEIVVLSFTDSDLSAFAAAADALGDGLPTLRLANIANLKHPMSVDIYLEKVAAHARFILVRLLGGLEYWRYGVEELHRLAQERGIPLAVVPGDGPPNPELASVSTLEPEVLERFRLYGNEGGVTNAASALIYASTLADLQPERQVEPPRDVSALAEAGRYCPKNGACSCELPKPASDRPTAAVIFYRSVLNAADTAPIDRMMEGLKARGIEPVAFYAASLKIASVARWIEAALRNLKPSIILNTTAFSARAGQVDTSPLDVAGVPVLQTALSGSSNGTWDGSARGLTAADLSMNVVLPEIDGRLFSGAVSFKAPASPRERYEFTPLIHSPAQAEIDHALDLASNWVRLGQTPMAERRIAVLLPDYPGKSGRAGSAVGLDGPGSAVRILKLLKEAGYTVWDIPTSEGLFEALTGGAPQKLIDLETYKHWFSALPQAFQEEVVDAWEEPGEDFSLTEGAFQHHVVTFGNITLMVQADRATKEGRKAAYHDPAIPPCHPYIAQHLWLRHKLEAHALLVLGAHGTLEWLPGKAVALSEACAPRALLGPTPLLYPFIVNNPGEAAQAKRRLSAATIGHMTPALVEAGSFGDISDIEPLFDEFAEAQALDPRRATRLADEILSRATASGLAGECGLPDDFDQMDQAQKDEAIVALDAWLCDLKELRIRDGQHIFGEVTASELAGDEEAELREQSAEAERQALLAGLDAKFISPGPSGAPSRGRLDVMPTGRNLFAVDPRSVPTRMAVDLGKRAADELLTRHLQSEGDWPRHVVLDLWASATMRTAGEDLGQAFALIGATPTWDKSAPRINGFEILPQSELGRPRIEVTLRVSGLFRDIFPLQMKLFSEAAEAVSALDEPEAENFLRKTSEESARVFGPVAGSYGTGLERPIATSEWQERTELAAAFAEQVTDRLEASERNGEDEQRFRNRLKSADAILHIADMAETDALDGASVALHVGGLAALVEEMRGSSPALYESDTSNPDLPKVRTYAEAVARITRARAVNPKWIEGQLRHGATGVAAVAETVDAVFAFAAVAGIECGTQFDLLFEAYVSDEEIAERMKQANPDAYRSILDRFEEAMDRKLWQPRRNSVRADLQEQRL